MSELNIRYETQEKELELAQLTHQYLTHKNKVMQWSILGIITLAVSISLLIYESFRRKQQQHQEEMNVARSFIDGLEQERTRISKELHDGVSNDLLGAGLLLRLLDEKPEIRKDVMESIEMIRNEVRTISHELNQPRFQNATLDEVAENMLSQIGAGESIRITFRKTGTSDEWKRIPHDISLEIYRILQELMANIVRHSDATRADISLEVTKSSLVLHITNDGKAYDPSVTNSNGIGYYTIEDRVKTIGAQFDTQITDGSQHYMLSVGWKPQN